MRVKGLGFRVETLGLRVEGLVPLHLELDSSGLEEGELDLRPRGAAEQPSYLLECALRHVLRRGKQNLWKALKNKFANHGKRCKINSRKSSLGIYCLGSVGLRFEM